MDENERCRFIVQHSLVCTFIATGCYLGHLTQRVVPSNTMTGSALTSQASETNLI